MHFRTPDPHAFAETVRRAAEEAGLGPMTYDRDAFALRGEGAALTIHLGNVYAEYKAARFWRRGAVLSGFVRLSRGLTQSLEVTPEQARAMLRPRVLERTFHGFMALRDEAEGQERPETPFREIGGGHLTLEVVMDRPDTIMSVRTEQLAEWGLTFEEALALGDQNLLRLGTDHFRSPRPGLFVSDWRDAYDASRLHLPGVVERLPVRGRPVAMVPNRDVLLVTGADDPEGLAAMARLAEETLGRPRPMSGYAFRLDGGWVPFLPPGGHAARVPLHRLAVRTLAGDYGEQTGLLDALYEGRGEDVFVAAVLVVEDRDTGDLTTVASWAEGVDTLLPRTERVAFTGTSGGGEAGLLGMAEWARVEAVAGEMMEPQGLYPERYRVRAFPSSEQLGRMGLA